MSSYIKAILRRCKIHILLAIMTPYTIFCAAAILFLCIVGTTSNLLIIGAILLENQLKNIGNVFIFNLAIIDLLVTTVVFPAIVSNTIAENILPFIGCFISGAVAGGGTMVSVLNIAAIAFERYIKICHNALYSRIFSKWIIPLHVILIWIVIIGALVPALIRGEKSFVYDSRVKLCMIEIEDLPPWSSMIFSSLLMSCILLSCICYFKILHVVRHSKRRVGVSIGSAMGSQIHSKRDVSLIKTMFTVFSVFLVLSSPISINLVFISANFLLPVELFQWSVYFVLCNSVVNGLIYGIINRQFRKGYMKCVNMLLCCTKVCKSSETMYIT